MLLNLHTKRFLKKILPFGLIWMAFALVYGLLEYGLIGQLDKYPSSGNPYNFKNNIIPLLIGSFLVGLFQGVCEIRWLARRFTGSTLKFKILIKTVFYIFFFAVCLVAFSLFNSYYNYHGYLLIDALDDLQRFAANFSFWSTLVFMGFIAGIALFFSEIIQYVGDGVIYNALFSKYHRPISEKRIFMFLDMKSSTAIAERLGHEKYFTLLKQYYADMTHAILTTEAEIYQYVGDEIVLSWPKDVGLEDNNCINAFIKIANKIDAKKHIYLEQFGEVPKFKAGFHIGEVTIGEIGTIKRNIIYTGDVLNTTARIEAECNNYKAQILISGELKQELAAGNNTSIIKIGALILRGKTIPMALYKVTF